MKKIKLFFKKPFIKKIVAPIVRGSFKSVPFVGTIIELASNIGAEFSRDKVVQFPDGSTAVEKPHNYLSIIFQILGGAVVIYAFFSGMLTPENVIEILKMFLPQ